MATAATAPALPHTGYKSENAVWSWLTTVDHKRIGALYLYTALAWFLIGGLEAVMIRIQLQGPNGRFVSAETYNQLFTMHGTTMIFLVVMPLSAAFFNLLIPLQIGARDVAFPRLNAFSYWVYLFGSLFMNASWLIGAQFKRARCRRNNRSIFIQCLVEGALRPAMPAIAGDPAPATGKAR